MARNDVERFIDELKGVAIEGKDADLYSLKKELSNLDNSSKVFEDFERETTIIDKNILNQTQDFNSLIKLKSLASEIKNKKQINDKLNSLHFNLNILKNSNDLKTVKNALNAFLYKDFSKIETIINELNDFKAKIDAIKSHHSSLLPKSLDNKLEIENKYNKHIDKLYSIHKKQKDILTSTIRIFLKMTKKHVKNLQKFK